MKKLPQRDGCPYDAWVSPPETVREGNLSTAPSAPAADGGSHRAGSEREGLLGLAMASLAVGLVTGLVCVSFRLALDRAETARESLLLWSHLFPAWGWVVPVAAAALATAAARAAVQRLAPAAAGSGIPQVESAVRYGTGLGGVRVLVVTFLGGLAAIGAGLALGREGPSVSMGANLGGNLARRLGLSPDDGRVLISGGAAAGLAAAFGAPLGGAVFVLEEVLQRFHGRTAIAVLGATGAATAVVQFMLGNQPLLTAPPVVQYGGPGLLVFLGFGLLMGGLGALYNRLVLLAVQLDERLTRVPPEARAATIGAAVAFIAWLNPRVVGSGEAAVQQLLIGATPPLGLLVVYCAFRFLLGPLSYASRAPGGLFAPLLLVGAATGALTGRVLHATVPVLIPDATVFVIVGAATFFTATVRAPVTGLVLLVEMTGVSSLLVPMLAAACGAFVGASLGGGRPIYDALRERAAAADTRSGTTRP
ncbi:MAG: chloride channel protein [Myxococcaceae bacterium]